MKRKIKVLIEWLELFALSYGIDIVLKRRREFWGFLLPYAITTIIAITSLIAQFR